MKKIGIITIVDNDNYGNRLQNYAVSNVLSKNFKVETLKNITLLNSRKRFFLRLLKHYYYKIKKAKKATKRNKCFSEFNKNITFNKGWYVHAYSKNINNKYDYFVVGSDQVWNPNLGRFREVDLLEFAEKEKRVAFSASFAISKLPEEFRDFGREKLNDFKAISVREDAGKRIAEDLTDRTDIEVLVDPTMLLTDKEWDKVSKKPEQLKSNKYILNYFLGELSNNRRNEIERIAKENNCEIINILDKNSPFYQTGPSEFLYLEKNAFLICTDSFHSCVFAILYNRPFVVFDREENIVSMSSRIETLINKFNLKNRKFEGKITKENLEHDYSEAYKILEKEREKSNRFLEKCLNDK